MANHIYLAGDSTVQTYGDSTNQGGWGQFLGSHLPEHIQVINRAIGEEARKHLWKRAGFRQSSM